jgi:hypothetical protein
MERIGGSAAEFGGGPRSGMPPPSPKPCIIK